MCIKLLAQRTRRGRHLIHLHSPQTARRLQPARVRPECAPLRTREWVGRSAHQRNGRGAMSRRRVAACGRGREARSRARDADRDEERPHRDRPIFRGSLIRD